jgi:hypothetical protein
LKMDNEQYPVTNAAVTGKMVNRQYDMMDAAIRGGEISMHRAHDMLLTKFFTAIPK